MKKTTTLIALLSVALIGILSFTFLYAGSTSTEEEAQADGTEQVTDTPKNHCFFSKGEATEKDWSKCSSKKEAKCGTKTDAEKADCKKKCDYDSKKAESTEAEKTEALEFD